MLPEDCGDKTVSEDYVMLKNTSNPPCRAAGATKIYNTIVMLERSEASQGGEHLEYFRKN